MTPPFGATLFYMKGTVPPGVTMTDVYRGMYPFVALQVVGLILCVYYPGIVLWLPKATGPSTDNGVGAANAIAGFLTVGRAAVPRAQGRNHRRAGSTLGGPPRRGEQARRGAGNELVDVDLRGNVSVPSAWLVITPSS